MFVPAGTVHAIGAGISLLEFQQNADVTYRLYDYGRPRELHLDDGIAVATAAPFDGPVLRLDQAGRTLVDGPHFTLVHFRRCASGPPALGDAARWPRPAAPAPASAC